MLEKIFKLESNNTSLGKEVLAGVTTFVTMAYIIFVNPQMMAESGMDLGASFVGTCLAASLACIIMGVYSNWPVSLAPGMGLNAFFTYTVVGEMGYSWEVALGAVFLAGILFFIMSVTRLRRWMLDSIPLNLRIAMGAGVGLFIGFIGLKNGGLIVANNATFLSLGDFTNPETLLAAFGFLIICSLSVRKTPGAILIGVILVTVMSILLGLVEFRGLVSMPPSSSGGTHLIQMLNMLEEFPIKEMGFGSSEGIHILAEVMKRAYADRSKYLGDSDFYEVPSSLTSKEYAKSLNINISSDKITPSEEVSPGNPYPYESPDTTHFSVMDASGNTVSNTYTLNFSYGSGKMIPGTGMFINNEMDDFSSKPGTPNGYGL